MNNRPSPGDVNTWFPPERQKLYIDHIIRKRRLTSLQTTCLIRLWGYGFVLQPNKQTPIHTLDRSIPTFSCSQDQAASLFYCEREDPPGPRPAGQMINRLKDMKLLKREVFDGGPARLTLNIPEDFLLPETNLHSSDFYPDAFDVCFDETPIAIFLAKIYTDWVNPAKGQVPQEADTLIFTILQGLRQWSEVYPEGLRVLRQVRDNEPVGFATFFPVHPDSERQVYRPPSHSLFLSMSHEEDPVQVASLGDEKCHAVFIRSWAMQKEAWNYSTVCQFLKDSQATLRSMQDSFPNLRTLHAIAIHPSLEALACHLGFKVIDSYSEDPFRWLYMSLGKFISLNLDEALVEFEFTQKL